MSAGPAVAPRRRLPWRGALLALLAVAVWHLPFGAAHPFNWDSVNYALASQHYDLRIHQPHPPGYPLWILAIRAVQQLGVDANRAQVLLSHLALAVTLLAVGDLARARGRAAQLLACALLLATPVVALHARFAGTYTSELMGSALVGWACADLWEGRRGRTPVAVGAWVLAAGLRTAGAVFLAPLLLVAMWRAWRGRPLRGLLWLLGAGLGVLAFYVPVWLSLGPLPASFAYWRVMLDNLFRLPFDSSSWFRGASAATHLGLLLRLAVWWSFALLPALVPVLLLRARRRRAAGAERADPALPPRADPPGDGRPAPEPSRLFLVLWTLPALVFLAGIYAPHPGYVLGPLPPLVLALLRAVPRGAGAPGRTALALGLLLVTAVLLGRPLYGPLAPVGEAPRTVGGALALASPAQIPLSDRQLDALVAALAERPAHEPLLVMEVDWNLANWRKLAWLLPERPVWWLNAARGGLAWMQHHERHEAPRLEVPAEAEVLWWVTQSEAPPPTVERAFPSAERVLHVGHVSLWRAERGARWPAELLHGPRRWPVVTAP